MTYLYSSGIGYNIYVKDLGHIEYFQLKRMSKDISASEIIQKKSLHMKSSAKDIHIFKSF